MKTFLKQTGSKSVSLKNGWLGVAVCLAVALTLIGGLTPEARAGQVIKIGATLPLSGPAGGDGQLFLEGRKLAVDGINASGGVLGGKLELVVRDDGMEPAKVGPLYENLVRDDKVDVFLSSYGAPMTMPAMAVADKYDKIMVSGYSSSTSLMEKYGGKRFFSVATQPKDKMFVNWFYRGLTDFFWDFDSWNHKEGFPKPVKIAVLNENQLWGIEQSKLWKPYAESQGWQVVMNEFVEMGQMEFSSIISKIKRLKPDVILAEFFYFRCVPFVKQLHEQGVTAPFIAMSESGTTAFWVDPEKGAGPKLGNGIFTFAYLPKTYHQGGIDDLRKTYRELHNIEPGFLVAAGYAGVQVLAQAIEMAGSTDSNELRAALLSGEFETCFTPAKFDAMGLNERFNPIIGQWLDGELENVYPLEVSTKRSEYPYAP